MSKLIDIQDMPGYKFQEGFKGNSSVSENKVFLRENEYGTYPSCYRHGHISCIAIRQDGKLYRCRELNCDEGCFMPKV